MPEMNIVQALNDCLRIEMRRDRRVVLLGEDVGRFGGVFRATAGLYEEFGPSRCIDTPLSEAGIIGTAIGLGVNGMKPVAEIQFADFIFPGFDQVVSELTKLRYRSGGEFAAPVVIRTPVGGGIRGGHYHSQSPEALFTHIAGIKVVVPSNPVDAKGLLATAIRGEDPVIFMEPKRVYRASRSEVPEGEMLIPFGQARIARPARGDRAVTVLAWNAMVHTALDAANRGEEHGVDLEVVDLRTLVPLDEETILESARRTGRVVVAHEAARTCGWGAELSAIIHEKAMLSLEAPVQRVTGLDTPFPYALEMEYMPDWRRILDAAQRTLEF